MPLRESKGNMYTFVTHTWNPIKGRCPHGCEYCYMKRFSLKEQRLDEKELKTDLGEGRFIFVGSGTDMWAESVPENWIERTLDYCFMYPDNTYLFQTKNPRRFEGWFPLLQKTGYVLGTTIETNRTYPQMKVAPDGIVPTPHDRAYALSDMPGRRMVTIEPIMDFDLLDLVYLIEIIDPEWVNIGADSGHNNLPEPPEYKIRNLIKQLREITQVHLKSNLSRIYKEA
ncbi:MAG: DUF5131 family protein [Spirochaetota bacterium]|nr:DUF5131 family protein [Spirochaetota bacterium]